MGSFNSTGGLGGQFQKLFLGWKEQIQGQSNGPKGIRYPTGSGAKRKKKARAQKTCPAEGPTLRARKAQKIGKAEKARPEQNKGEKNARQAKSQATRELRCLRHPASGTKHLLSEQQRNYSAAQKTTTSKKRAFMW